MRWAVLVFLVLLVLPRAGTAAQPVCRDLVADPAYAGEIARARALVPRLRSGLRAPGLALAVVVRGRVVWSLACGQADRERGIRVDRTTRFRIGSVSKPLTATALAVLVERGRIRFDAPIRRYVPAFPRKRWSPTVAQVAGHTAGLRGNEADELVSARHFPSVSAELSVFARDPLLFRPGTRFSYSNWGYVLLGAAIEGASGRPFGSFVRAAVTGPLGLRATALEDVTRPVPRRAQLYEITDDGRAVRAPFHDPSIRWPSGGFLSTAEELARFGSAALGGRLLRPATVRRVLAEGRTADGRRTGYALGWEVHASPWGRLAGHTGNAVGGSAALLVHPRSGTALALTTNIGYVTAGSPKPIPRSTPEPPLLLAPFLVEKRR